MQKHVRILGWCYIAMAVVNVLLGMLVFGMLSGLGAMSGEPGALVTMSAIGGFAGSFIVILAIPSLLVGLGFLKNWGGWVIILACVISLFHLAHFPIGTALSLYTFWVAYMLYQAQDGQVPPANAA